MKNESKQYISDTIALGAQEARQSLWALHPEASLGGDGPWNGYGDDHAEPAQYILPQFTGEEWFF